MLTDVTTNIPGVSEFPSSSPLKTFFSLSIGSSVSLLKQVKSPQTLRKIHRCSLRQVKQVTEEETATGAAFPPAVPTLTATFAEGGAVSPFAHKQF